MPRAKGLAHGKQESRPLLRVEQNPITRTGS
jgi:hypothetical protein